MAEIALTTKLIKPCFSDPGHCEIYSQTAAECITKGEALYILAAGTVGVADGNDNDKDEAQFVALTAAAGVGDEISCLRRGPVAGFTVAAVDCGKVIHLSETPGDFQVDAGDEPVGRVIYLPDHGRVIYFNFQIDADIG